jgi:hypothetical protein
MKTGELLPVFFRKIIKGGVRLERKKILGERIEEII